MLSIVIGSTRKDSQSAKVAQYIANKQNHEKQYNKIDVIDLFQLGLPFWSEENFEKNKIWSGVSKGLKDSSAFIFITPEWDGMASPAIKNFFTYCRKQELHHKPALLIAVSAGQGGSYPIAELRMSSYKNSRICYLPDHVIIRHVQEVLNQHNSVNENDIMIRNRIEYALKVLLCYANAFKIIREQEFIHNSVYLNGM